MRFAVNYIDEEVEKLSTADDTYIKYPGGSGDLETLKKLCNKNFKIVLHGVLPSSGSILDPHLCDKFEAFSKYIKMTNQQWLSFHFDYKQRYGEENYIATLEKNLSIIRSYFPHIIILLENLPPVDNIEEWCADPKLFDSILDKYNLKMLLDIPHTQISAEYFGLPFEDYINQFDLSKVVEIHFSGLGKTDEGKLYDGHIKAEQKDYDCLSYVLPKCQNLKMISLEFAPTRDYDNQTVAKEYKSKRTAEDLFREQQEQLQKIKAMADRLQTID